ncbi:MAG: response regulator transcription factor [Kiritimatiellae bacterium]|nr:response regulator transcription factor [Kiritimatiellia bacterium]
MGTRERKIRILLADDHLIVRMGMASILSFEEDMEVVGEAGNGLDAVKMAAELSPDVVLMDLQMPELGGADATAKIHEANPNIKILILTTFGTSADLKKAMDGGAAGALIKNSSQNEIIAAIRGAVVGERTVSSEIRHTLRDLQSIPELSPRQLEILNLIAKGFSNSEIAGIAGISLETVKDHIKKILMRLGVSSRTEAASLAINLNLIGG